MIFFFSYKQLGIQTKILLLLHSVFVYLCFFFQLTNKIVSVLFVRYLANVSLILSVKLIKSLFFSAYTINKLKFVSSAQFWFWGWSPYVYMLCTASTNENLQKQVFVGLHPHDNSNSQTLLPKIFFFFSGMGVHSKYTTSSAKKSSSCASPRKQMPNYSKRVSRHAFWWRRPWVFVDMFWLRCISWINWAEYVWESASENREISRVFTLS